MAQAFPAVYLGLDGTLGVDFTAACRPSLKVEIPLPRRETTGSGSAVPL